MPFEYKFSAGRAPGGKPDRYVNQKGDEHGVVQVGNRLEDQRPLGKAGAWPDLPGPLAGLEHTGSFHLCRTR